MQKRDMILLIEKKYQSLSKLMDERMRRQWAAAESLAYGWGGLQAVSNALNMSPNTIRKGLAEIIDRENNPEEIISPRLRREGGGRKRCSESDLKLVDTLMGMVEPMTRGDPESPLRWTCLSTSNLAKELTRQGHRVSPRTVGRLLVADGYSLQSNRKTKEGGAHPDRNTQFEYINTIVKQFQRKDQPVISVDTKKKELIGEFKNSGREWRPIGEPETVNVHDFLDKELGKAIPYGVYDLSENKGWVSVGIDHDTAHFAVEAIRRWWKKMGLKRYRGARQLLITADGGGSNGSRCRLWKIAIQELATWLGIPIYVSHFPPGTSKWNKIEHRMFCHITQNWRGRPLISHEIIIQLIANTTTRNGLKIQAELDTRSYPTGISVSPEEFAALKIKRAKFHGDWNYILLPKSRKT
jgi:Rhodopirellula transposase.